MRQAYYFVPARYAGRRLDVRLGARTIRALDPSAHGKQVACHVRSLHKGSEDLVLDHYLQVLERKPGALASSTALAAARASGAFTPVHQRFWDATRRALGDQHGTRALVSALLLHRILPAAAVTAGIEAALGISSFDPDLVAVEARRFADAGTKPATPVVSDAATGIGSQRATPSLAGYDRLLTPSTAQTDLQEALA